MLEATWKTSSRSKDTDSTRAGPLTPELLITLLLFMAADAGRRGYGLMLDAFWEEAGRSGIALGRSEPVSAAAFCKARRKLKPQLLAALLAMVGAEVDRLHGRQLLWHGRRIFAVDGMRHNLQRGSELAAHFGVPHGGHCPQMLVSVLYDVFGRFSIAATIAPAATSERNDLLKLLPHLQPGDVLVIDRGYPSFEVLKTLRDAGIEVVIRVPTSGSFDAIQVFHDSGGDDYRVLVYPSPSAARAGVESLDLRCVSLDVSGGDPWTLLTTLRRSEVSLSQLQQIYHLCWEIEEFYKLLKSDGFSLRQLHAKSVDGVEQELFAQLLLMAMSRLLMVNAAAEHETPHCDLSAKAGVMALASGIVRLLLCDDPERRLEHHGALLRRLARHRQRRRPGRSSPRRSFKPGLRWNSKGKVGG